MRRLVPDQRRSGANGRIGAVLSTECGPGAREVLVGFERIEYDWTERGPTGMRRLAAAERVCSDRHVGEIAAGLWSDFVDHAEVAVEKDAPVLRIPQDS